YRSLILKHAQPFAAYANSKLIFEGLGTEYRALRAVSESPLCGKGSLIGVPAVIHYDEDIHPPPPSDLVAVVATRLAEFIAELHVCGKGPNKVVDSPKPHVVISRAALSGMVDPLLEEVVDMFKASALTSDETPIMGDYWLGNILIAVEDAPDGAKINTVIGKCMRRHFLKAYAGAAKIEVEPFRVVMGMGFRWINWARPLGRGNGEIRECVDIGVEYIRRGTERSEDWLATS
ncbi:hypothetical protein BV22DRAFT_1038156, partial [Leucogyrophana mollusca]